MYIPNHHHYTYVSQQNFPYFWGLPVQCSDLVPIPLGKPSCSKERKAGKPGWDGYNPENDGILMLILTILNWLDKSVLVTNLPYSTDSLEFLPTESIFGVFIWFFGACWDGETMEVQHWVDPGCRDAVVIIRMTNQPSLWTLPGWDHRSPKGSYSIRMTGNLVYQ